MIAATQPRQSLARAQGDRENTGGGGDTILNPSKKGQFHSKWYPPASLHVIAVDDVK